MIRTRLIQQQLNHIFRFSFLRQKRIKLFVKPWLSADVYPSCRAYRILVKMSSETEKKAGKNAEKVKKKCLPRALLDEIRGNKVTRSYTKETEKNWREHFLKLPIDEKRKLYHCGKKYVKLDDVEGWPSYAANVNRTAEPKFDVNEELNMKISLWRGDITALEIDVICNAANNSLLGGGGVDGAIHRAAGKKLYEECSGIGGCETGDAKLTGGYKLPAKYILHTVGPIGIQPKALKSCYLKCLNLAKEKNLRTIAFPCISTGIYGYDVELATPVVMQTVRDWLLTEENSKSVDKIIFCVFLIKDVQVYEKNLHEFFPVDKSGPEPEEKKPKAIDETKTNTKKDKEQKDKEQKENRSEKSTEKEMTELKAEKEKKESEFDLPEKKKSKTVEETKELPEKKKPKTGTVEEKKGNTKKEKQLKEKSEEKKTETDVTKLKSETEKKENEQNNWKTSCL